MRDFSIISRGHILEAGGSGPLGSLPTTVPLATCYGLGICLKVRRGFWHKSVACPLNAECKAPPELSLMSLCHPEQPGQSLRVLPPGRGKIKDCEFGEVVMGSGEGKKK